ncbi:MAG: AAA family ATPase [Candidatus Dojkabacteria bacterium]
MSAPQAQPQVRRIKPQPHAQEDTAGKVILNLSEYMAKGVFRFLLDLGDRAHNRGKKIITIYDMFLSLERLPQFANENVRLKYDKLEVEEKMLLAIKRVVVPVRVEGKVFFTPRLKSLLLHAFLLSKRTVDSKITLKDIWQSLFESEEISTLIFGKAAKQQTITAQKNETPAQTQISTLSQLAPNIAKLTQDLTLVYKSNTVKPMINRQKELNQLLRIMTREDNHNPLLVGESGVGKETLVHGLAYELIYNQQIPAYLKDYRVLQLNFSTLIASSEYPGSNLPQFMDEINRIGKLILFVDGIRFSQVSQEQYVLNNFLSLLFRNNSIIVIISTDPAFYLSQLEKEQTIKENFEVIKVEEPTKEVLLQILAEETSIISKKHNIQIDSGIFEPLIDLAKRYMASSSFPQKAISLLGESAAAARLSKQSSINIDNIKKILAEKTGIPIQSISVSDREKLLKLEGELNSVVIGQQHAVSEVVEAIKRSRAGLKDAKKPIGSFLFLGPTGVGKTELAKQIASKYYEDAKAFVRLDMSEYSEKHTSQRLIGSPPGYTGYEEGGQFTNPVIQKPYSLILLDEAEKAHPQIFDIFLQVLDEGRLTDSRGKLADFRNSILIFTSNIASQLILEDLSSAESNFKKSPKAYYEQVILPELLKVFRPEFINRFDEIIPFNPLGVHELIEIAKLKIRRVKHNLKEKQITLETPDTELEKLVRAAYDPRFGARPIERMIKDKIETPIAEKIVAGGFTGGNIINWKYQ